MVCTYGKPQFFDWQVTARYTRLRVVILEMNPRTPWACRHFRSYDECYEWSQCQVHQHQKLQEWTEQNQKWYRNCNQIHCEMCDDETCYRHARNKIREWQGLTRQITNNCREQYTVNCRQSACRRHWEDKQANRYLIERLHDQGFDFRTHEGGFTNDVRAYHEIRRPGWRIDRS